MNCPRIEVDLGKIRRNTQTLVRRLGSRGISITGVTKAVCGHPEIAQAMLDGGATGLADSRISNVQRLRAAEMTCPITLIRTPMLSQVEKVVQSCETSYNTEITVISALAGAAIRNGIEHSVILMLEMGDRRDGILPENLADVAQQVAGMSGVALAGIGANFACLSGIAPTVMQMDTLNALANEIEIYGPFLQIVSGGNSANLPWALGDHTIGRINDLRLGEAILLGVEPLSGDQIEGMHTDAFTLVAEVIETGLKPTPGATIRINPTIGKLRTEENSDAPRRLILALGHQDTNIQGLSLAAGYSLIGATSDHLVIETNRSLPAVGSEVIFQMDYAALMHAMTTTDITIKLFDDRPRRPSSYSQGKDKHLALV